MTAHFDRNISFLTCYRPESLWKLEFHPSKILMTFFTFFQLSTTQLLISLLLPISRDKFSFHPSKIRMTYSFQLFQLLSNITPYSSLQNQPFITAHFVHHCTLKHALMRTCHFSCAFLHCSTLAYPINSIDYSSVIWASLPFGEDWTSWIQTWSCC